jgi:uncharacterized membrane protein YfcA
MSGRNRSALLLAGVAAGLSGGLFGVGGGIVLVPLLTAFFGLSQHRAHGTSLATIGATAAASLFVYGAHSNVIWGTAALVAVASVITARVGARWATRVSTHVLRRAFAILLVVVAVRLLWKAPAATGSPFESLPVAVGFDLLLGAAVGLISGFLGVGGGGVAVPAFALVLGMSQQAAQGTSLAVVLVTAPAGALEHHRHGNVALPMVLWLALGAALGGPASSWVAQILPHEILARVFAVFLLLTGVQLWIRSRAARRAPTAPGK